MAKMESRVNFLESQLSTSLENLDAFSVQLTVIQDFLQKQFGKFLYIIVNFWLNWFLYVYFNFNALGSRFVDYANNRGLFIQKPVPTTSRSASNSYYTSTKGSNATSTNSQSKKIYLYKIYL
jgi:hypothetical protein